MKPVVTRHTTHDELPEWLTAEETQVYLNLGRTAVYDAMRSGKWPVLRVGKLRRVHKSAFAPEAQ
jgi:excisionase family DNA binding protein